MTPPKVLKVGIFDVSANCGDVNINLASKWLTSVFRRWSSGIPRERADAALLNTYTPHTQQGHASIVCSSKRPTGVLLAAA